MSKNSPQNLGSSSSFPPPFDMGRKNSRHDSVSNSLYQRLLIAQNRMKILTQLGLRHDVFIRCLRPPLWAGGDACTTCPFPCKGDFLVQRAY